MRHRDPATIPGPILVSACLLGQGCRYDGGHCRHEAVLRMAGERGAVPVCPEVLGGLLTPRPPVEIAGGGGGDVLVGKARVVDRDGRDCTEAFLRGARAVLAAAEKNGTAMAVLKERSPSCGVHWIYDGAFNGRKIEGQGVTAALLAASGMELYSEEDLGKDGGIGNRNGRESL